MRWLSVVAAIGAWSCTGPLGAESGHGGPRARLELFIPDTTADSPQARPMERPFDMVLTNLSDRPLWVSSGINYSGPSPTQGSIEIIGPSGPVHPSCKSCKGESPPYRALARAEQMRVHSDLWCFGRLLEPGVYTARATYSPTLAAETYYVYGDGPNGREALPPPPEGVDPLAEDIVSDPVRFTVRAPPPGR